MPLTPPPTSTAASANSQQLPSDPDIAPTEGTARGAPTARKTRAAGKTATGSQVPPHRTAENPFAEASAAATGASTAAERAAHGAGQEQGNPPSETDAREQALKRAQVPDDDGVRGFAKRAKKAGYFMADGKTPDTRAFRRVCREKWARDKGHVDLNGTVDTAAYERQTHEAAARKRGCVDSNGEVDFTKYRRLLRMESMDKKKSESSGSFVNSAYEQKRKARYADREGLHKDNGSPDVKAYCETVRKNTAANAGFYKKDGDPDVTSYSKFLDFRKNNRHLFNATKAVDMYAEYILSDFTLPAPPAPRIYQFDEASSLPAPSAETASSSRQEASRDARIDPVDDVVEHLHKTATPRVPSNQSSGERQTAATTSSAATPDARRERHSYKISLETLAQVAAQELSRMTGSSSEQTGSQGFPGRKA